MGGPAACEAPAGSRSDKKPRHVDSFDAKTFRLLTREVAAVENHLIAFDVTDAFLAESGGGSWD